jgi:putative DNA primase/helicase
MDSKKSSLSPIKQLKEAVGGNISSVLSAMGLNSGMLDLKKNHYCQICRQNKIHIHAPDGHGYCNGCGVEFKDFIGIVSHQCGYQDDWHAAQEIAKRMNVDIGVNGIQGVGKRKQNPSQKAESSSLASDHSTANTSANTFNFDDLIFWNDTPERIKHSKEVIQERAPEFCNNIKPVLTNVFDLVDIQFVQRKLANDIYPKFAVPIYRRISGQIRVVNYATMELSGEKRNKARSMVLSGKDRDGVFLSKKSLELLEKAEPLENCILIRIEGITDFLSLVCHAETRSDKTYIAFSGAFGADDVKYKHWLPELAKKIKPQEVWIVPDNDPAGLKVTDDHAKALSGLAPIKIVHPASGCKDIREYLTGRSFDDFVQLADQAEQYVVDSDPRPVIELTKDEANVASEVVKALGTLAWEDGQNERYRVYSRGGNLCQIVPHEDPNLKGQLKILNIPLPVVRERITQACRLVSEKRGKSKEENNDERPPKWLVESVYHRGYYDGNIRPLVGIVDSPTIRTDGSILQTPGWDPATGLLYRPIGDYPVIPQSPTRDDATKAAARILDLICDFPFAEGQHDATAWVSYLLTLVARHSISGCCPLFAVSANAPGSGKGRLLNIASLIAYGRACDLTSWISQSSELRKSLTTWVLDGRQTICFDNIDGPFGNAELDMTLTSTERSDRLLSTNKSLQRIPMRIVFCATGQNLVYLGDMGRRVVPIRLKTEEEQPHNRTDFKYPDILGHVRQNRPQYVCDALTILRAYFAAGLPAQPGGTFGSFEEWHRIIRGSLVWLGLADPMQTRNELAETDSTRGLHQMVIHALLEIGATGSNWVKVSEFEKKIYDTDQFGNSVYPILAEACSEICGPKFNAKKLGNILRKFENRKFENQFITRRKDRTGVMEYQVLGLPGLKGSKTLTSREGKEEEVNSNNKRIGDSVFRDPANPTNPADPEAADFTDIPVEEGVV